MSVESAWDAECAKAGEVLADERQLRADVERLEYRLSRVDL